ncbi:MAG TPA: sulfotransferase domain-containing protein [Rhizomicrobium sp.]|jgi:hypothetical protein
MSKIFIHLGAHKTATTFVQRNLMANADIFEKQGWKLIWFQVDLKKARKVFVKFRGNAKLKPNQKRLLDDTFESIRNDPSDILLTYEGFLGSSSMKQGRLYANHALPIKMLKDAFSGRDIKIGFCIRNFPDHIESSYNYRVSVGQANVSFAKYVQKVSVQKLSWLKIIENLSTTFGAENLVLWTYEDFKKDGVVAFSKIVQAAGIDTTDIAAVLTAPQLVSLNAQLVRLLKRWHDAARDELDISPQQARLLRGKLHAILEELPRPAKTEGHFGPKRRKLYTEHYEHEVALIRERWGDQMLNFGPGSASDHSAIEENAQTAAALQAP